MPNEGDVGVVGGVNVGLPILMTMGAFLTVGLYNVIELTFLIFAVFQRRKGLYFWSLIISTWGIVPHALGFVFKFFEIFSVGVIASAIVAVGWPCMVTGQSLVLYSRLHLVVQSKRRLKWVLHMIIFNAIFIHIPVIVLALSSEATHLARYTRLFVLFDKIQIVIFFIQEAIISIMYIYETVRLLGYGDKHNEGSLRKLLRHLIIVNVVVLVFDVTLLATQFSGHYEIQTTYKTAVYSIKLKIEFNILNRIVDVVENRRTMDSQENNSLPLRTWTSRKESDITIGTGKVGSFLKLDCDETSVGGEKGRSMSTSDVSIQKFMV